MIDLATLADDLAPDGTLRHIYVFGTDLKDWDRVLAHIAKSYTTVEYWLDRTRYSSLPRAEAIFAIQQHFSSLLRVTLNGVIFQCHFFTPDEIEFDIDPREIDTPERLQALLEFVEGLGQSTGKTVVVTPENSPKWAFLRYDPHRFIIEHVHA
jgi:hypothetical protein